MKVEFQLRWLLLLLSIVVLFTLRHHRWWMLAYCVVALAGVLVYAFWLPKLAANAERRFSRESLRLLAAGEFAALDDLAGKQWLIRRFGRPHIIPETKALAAGAAGRMEAARALYLEALAKAPPDERPRIELNLANAEVATGHLDAAEGRYRVVMTRRPDLTQARVGLARLLIQRGGDTLDEAEALVEGVLQECTQAEQAELTGALAEAQKAAGRS